MLGEEDHGPQFFSPATIRQALEVQAAKTTEVEAKKAQIASNKANKAI